MEIWVDADACPGVIKDILFRVAERLQLQVTLVEIVERLAPGDLVVTGDIPLAARVLEKGGDALNPRGDFYTKDNIAQQLTMRAFMEELRSGGVDTGGPSAFSQADRQQFANSLDRYLARRRPGT
jgi:uncharacterized protein YaiI (UPF0178 family)